MSNFEFKKVESSNIEEIAYDEKHLNLLIRFKSKKGKEGKVYAYNPVGPHLVSAFINADSMGGFFAEVIKDNPKITCKRIEL